MLEQHEQTLHNYWQDGKTVRRLAAQDGHQTLAERLAWQDVLRRYLPAGRRRMRILEVGTGAGGLSRLLASSGHRCVAVDWSRPLLDVAAQRAWEEQVDCHWIEADALNLPVRDDYFDVVIARRVLTLLAQPERALHQWRNVLRAQGRVIVIEDDWSAPDAERLAAARSRSDSSALDYAAQRARQQLPLWHAPPAEIEAALHLAGFESVQQTPVQGQLLQTGKHLGRAYSVGYVLLAATKPDA